MTRYLIATAAALGLAGVASAQFQQPTVMPNVFNPQNQPLSPYLNLLRGGNAGVNYYYGVRPGTVGGTGQPIGPPLASGGGNRQLFFPQLASAPDPLQPREVGVGDVLPPAGHPVSFNNTGGYFPSPGGRSGMRPGLAGVGTTRPPGR